MNLAHSVDTWRAWRLAYFRWLGELAWTRKVLLAFAMASATGLAAQVRIPLGFTPVPVTGQVLAVLLSGVLLGAGYGCLSQVIYVVLGAVGMPWFSGLAAGVPLGPTGGYLVGFIPAAYLVGWLTARYARAGRLLPQVAIMTLAVGVIYLFGAVQFALLMHTGLRETLALAVLPFIPVDFLKALAAAALARTFLPSTAGSGPAERK